jgi:hypothetical protein
MRANHIAVFATLAAPFALALPLRAETASPFASYFGAAKDGLTCWARTYDAAHLDTHPEQKTESIAIDVARTKTSGEANTPDSFEIGFAFKIRTRPEWYGQAGVCKAEGAGFSCFLEADGGLFRLTPEAPDTLRLETGDYGISIEGSQDFVTLDGKAGDDKVFVLQRSKAECDAANAFFTQQTK